MDAGSAFDFPIPTSKNNPCWLRILLLSSVGDKPVKLVRESFVHVKVKEPTDGSQYRHNYEHFMSFDAAIITQANYGIQAVNQ